MDTGGMKNWNSNTAYTNMRNYLIYCFRNYSCCTYYLIAVLFENSFGSPSYSYVTLREGLAFIEVMNVFFRTRRYQITWYLILIRWPNFVRDPVLILFRRKNLIVHLGQRISGSSELTGKPSALYY